MTTVLRAFLRDLQDTVCCYRSALIGHGFNPPAALQQACDEAVAFINSLNPRPLDIAVPKSEYFEGKRPKTSSGE